MRKRSISLAAAWMFFALLHGFAAAETAPESPDDPRDAVARRDTCPASTSVFPVSFLPLARYEIRVPDGGPGDLDGAADGACTLAVSACVGSAACTPEPVERVRVTTRGRSVGAAPRDVAAEIVDAFAQVPGAVRSGNSITFPDGTVPETCGQAQVRVPASSRPDQNFSLRVSVRGGRSSSGSRVRLRCISDDGSDGPPAPACFVGDRMRCPIEPGEPGAPTTTTTTIDEDPATTTSTVETSPATTSTLALPPNARTFYISPAGDDDNSGTSRSAPFRRFSTVIAKLRPGDLLVVLSGTYTRETTGLPSIDCDGEAANGTEAAPITIRAENEREAFLSSDGTQTSFEMRNCGWWNIEGLRAANQDNAGGDQTGGHPFRFSEVHHVQLRRLLGSHNNRRHNTHVYAIEDSRYVLLEECEAYFYHRHAFSIWKSYGVVLRRCYANSMRYGQDGCCSTIDNRNFGDSAVALYGSSSSIVENCISENHANGFHVAGVSNSLDPSGHGGRHNKILGSISLDDAIAGLVSSRTVGGDYNNALGNVFRDFVAIETEGIGLFLRGAADTVIENVTLYASSDAGGLVADGGDPGVGGTCGSRNPEGCDLTARNVLALYNDSYGIAALEQHDWDVEYSNAIGGDAAWSAGEPIGDGSGNVRESLMTDPGPIGRGEGECIAWIPSDSPMKGAGRDGRDIGANVVYRYENGQLTSAPLWNLDSGAFPCGAVVEGINDGERGCRNVHRRLNVNVNGCALPLSTPP